MFHRTCAAASIALLLLAASLTPAADKKPATKAFKLHPVNKTFYIDGEMTAAQVEGLQGEALLRAPEQELLQSLRKRLVLGDVLVADVVVDEPK